MSVDINATLQMLQTKDVSLSIISQSTIDSKELDTLMEELRQRYQLPSCQNFHNQAFYAVLIGTAYFILDEHRDAINWLETADCQFRNQGETWNQCIGLIILGLAYQSADEQYQAICAFEKAQHLLLQEIRIHKNDYGLDYQGLISNLDIMIRNARQNPTRKKTAKKTDIHVLPKISKANQAWSPARIIYSVRDFGHANQNPEYDMNEDQISEMSIDAISFDGVGHTVYNLRRGAGNQIKLTSSGNYRWLKVAGNSMNHASPVPIEPGDYALADLDQEPQIGNIVIANLHNPPTPVERAGVIKRYTRKGLNSESIESIDPIPLDEADIRGVVIAVAKTSAVTTYPVSHEEEDCYKTLLNMVAGHKNVVEALINHEYELAPDKNREDYLMEAIRRLKRELHSI